MKPPLSNYLELIDGGDFSSVQIFHHNDADGVCAAASAHGLIRSCKPALGVAAEWVGTHQFDFEAIRLFLESNQGKLVLCFDLNFFSKKHFLQFLINHTANCIVVVDDHRATEWVPDVDKILINPSANNEVECPPSLFAYQAALQARVELPEWLPMLGLYADRQLDQYRHLFSEVPSHSELLETVIQLTSIYLQPGLSNKENAPFDLLIEEVRSKHDWKQFRNRLANDEVLGQSRAAVQRAIEGAVSEALKGGPLLKRKGRHDILVFRQHGHFRITNIVSSRLSARYLRDIVIVFRQEQDQCFFEVRVGRDIDDHDIAEALRRVSRDVHLNTFGGHARAGGGSCKFSDLESMVEQYEAHSWEPRLAN